MAVAFSIATAHAGIIYQQAPSAGSAGYLSSTYNNGGSNLEEFVWDSFSTATTQTLREIQWRGTRSGPAPTDFQISINTIAIPGGTVWHTNSAASETATATPGVYDYKFTLPAGFVLTGGQGYWLQVIGLVGNYYPYWQWSAGTGGNGSHIAQVPAVTGDYRYISASGDTAFTLLNQATVPVTITLAKSPSAGGTVTGGGTYAGGANVTVNATAASGRTFLNWTEAGVIVSTSASFTFAADGNKTLTANFSGPNTGPYMITAIANPSVSGTVGGAGMVNAGEIRELDVTAADGLSFVGWTENGDIVNLPYNAAAQVFEVTATADRTLVANFAYPAYTSFINGVVSPVSSGTMVIAGTSGLSSGSYYGGTQITFNATPYAGYHFVYWRQGAGLGDISGAPHVVGTTPTLKHIVCYGTTITAVFEPNNPVLTLTSSPVAGGTNTGAGTYVNGSNVTVNATPAVGYAFVNWKEGVTIKSTSQSYTFPITNHTSLTATYVATNRTISAGVTPAASGSVTGAGVVGNGATVTLTATPSPGYIFSNWTLGGAHAGNTNPIVFIANADYAFVATFTALPVLTASPAVAGVLSFSWPSSATGWVLQESPDLSPASWVNSARAVSQNAGQNTVTVPAPSGSLFFRLAHP